MRSARLWLFVLIGVVWAVGGTACGSDKPLPPVRHVFVINLENKGFNTTWGANSPAHYLNSVLRPQGVLLTNYFATAHNSLPNYIAQISGQGPDSQTQADCPTYTSFNSSGVVAPYQFVGNGCVYPTQVPTVAGQLAASGRSWRGYLEDMGTPCRHPALGGADATQHARVGDQYATKHNPFVYFAAITGSPDCAQRDVDLNQLPSDIASVNTTANLTYITPNLCNDGHDSPCVDGRAGGLTSADQWLATWVPRIMNSPAFRQDGMLVITFDESDGAASDATACCGESATPNSRLPGIKGPGGGRIGALVLSPFVRGGTTTATAYNHYSLLATVEDLFSLTRLGYARDAAHFGSDVFNR